MLFARNVIYEQKDCIRIHSNGSSSSKTHVATPEHSHRSRRNACGCTLMKTKHGIVLTSRKVFPYRPIIKSISALLSKPGIVDMCEQWRQRSSSHEGIEPQHLGDVYDGQIWKTFTSEEYNNFLSIPHSYLLTLNVDWFRPLILFVVQHTLLELYI